MRKTTRRLAIVAGAVGLVVAMSGCSTISTDPSQAALRYSGGSFSSKSFEDCVPASNRDTHGPGKDFYVYPDNSTQRDFTADSKAADREADTITVVSKDTQEIAVPMTVTFNLNTDCKPVTIDGQEYKGGVFEVFHEKHGLKRHAYWNYDDEGDARPDGAPRGWIALLGFAIGTPLDRAADVAARSYDWKTLTQDTGARAAFEKDLNTILQDRVDVQMTAPMVGGQQIHFFENIHVTVGTPVPTNATLLKAVSDEQAAIAQANTAEKKADADTKAANAEVAVAKARAAAQRAELDALGEDAYIKKYAIDHNVNPFPNPIVAPQGPAAK